MEILDYIVVALLTFIALISIIGLYLFLTTSKDAELESNAEDLKRINETLYSVQNNSNQIQEVIQSFKNPMDSLDRMILKISKEKF